LSVKFFDGPVFVLELVFEGIDLLPVEILKFVLELFKLFAENAVLFDFILELLSGNLGAGVVVFVVFFLWLVLNFFENRVELVVEKSELRLE